MERTFSASSEAVNPVGAVDNARTASATRRILGLLKSIPPTLVFPTWVGSGNFSRVSSDTRQASRHPTAFRNRSRIPRRRVTISPKHGSDRPQRYALVFVHDDFDAEGCPLGPFAFGIDLQA